MQRSARRAAALLGLGLAVAVARTGKVRNVAACLWRHHPDTAYLKCDPIDVQVPKWLIDAEGEAKRMVDEMEKARNIPRGVTLTLEAGLGPADLTIDIDIYSDQELPPMLGISDSRAAVIAEPRGYVGDTPVNSFYALAAMGETADLLHGLVKEYYTQVDTTDIRVATFAGVRTTKLVNLIAWAKASRNFSADLTAAIPLMYRPWTLQIARDAYRLAPRDVRGLAGTRGLEKAMNMNREALRRTLKRYYELRGTGELAVMYPRSMSTPAHAHEKAVETLRKILAEAFNNASSAAAKEILSEKGLLSWNDYVKALAKSLAQAMQTH